MSDIYSKVEANPNFSKIEENILQYWKTNNIFQKSLALNKNKQGSKNFILYDGPPFANGLPHYGHLLTGFIKDAIGRYQTMLGKYVERRFGWDCHGLPAELDAENNLGISGKIEIEKYGIDKFNAYCQNAVLRYTKEWEDYVTRQARWVDFSNDYKTMNPDYMESVIWAFKELHKKGLIYQSMRVMPYSWKCETPVSDFETRLDNSYREKKSKSVILGFELTEIPNFAKHTKCKSVQLMVWTTTPWTLPSNLALAINANIKYVGIVHNDICYIVAENLAPKYKNEIGEDVVFQINGDALVGLKYKPIFDYFAGHQNAFVVLSGDFVTTEDGTGIVHIAPGFGEDDFNLCVANDIELVCPVDNGGKFQYPVSDYVGKQVFETNDDIIIRLKQQGLWLKTEQYIHNYPHCWRTDTPLIYKAVPSWYVKVTEIKDNMVKNNQFINWIPEHIKNGLFGKWLENARDWSISRNRYWGCPIPVWQSDDPEYPNTEVYGSIAELEEAFGVKIENLHRPFIDNLVRPNSKDPSGKSMMRRVPEVLDCWFESGSMPYAQVHYPFENRESFNANFPADFIVEYVAQTRGWFYTMMVLSTALFDKPPFLNCICHGVILGDGGNKLSKRLKNYADPQTVFTEYGADAMRWFMLSSPVMRGYEVSIDTKATGVREALKMVVKPMWNAYNFFILYANADNITARFSFDSKTLLDRYILTKCVQTAYLVKKGLDEYDTISATDAIVAFIEILNNWYIRRSREKFWRSEHDESKIDAYNTLYTVLDILCKISAPLLPCIADAIYIGIRPQNKKEDDISVHLEKFPDYTIQNDVDTEIITNMERVRDACNAALFIRNENEIKIRQPLSSVTFVGVSNEAFSEELKQLVLDEINVKEWKNLAKERISEFADYVLKLNLPVLAKRLASKVQQLIKLAGAGKWEFKNGGIFIDGEELLNGEYELKLNPKTEYKNVAKALSTNDAIVLLDLNVTEELEQEGIARDFVRAIQQMRKDSGFEITDKINVTVRAKEKKIDDSLNTWRSYIMTQILCVDFIVTTDFSNDEDFSAKSKAFRNTIAISDIGDISVVISVL